jgi:hypothetical protein
VQGYRQPQLIIVDGSTPTSCGTASNATGPFYCPPEETVYIDPTFFDVLEQQFGDKAGDLAQLYVLAHEYGHHIQQITGIFDQYPNNGTGPDSNGVRTELQADCFAGAWVADAAQQTDAHGVAYIQTPTDAQIDDALAAAAAVGDDHIQQQSSGVVNPESWTHGSSEQRQRWFMTGYQGGPQACNTFGVSGATCDPGRRSPRRDPVPGHRALRDGLPPRRRRPARVLGAVGQPRRQAGGVPARWAGRRYVTLAPALLRPRDLPHRAVRPARLRQVDAAHERARCRSPLQHDMAPRRRHGTAPQEPRHRPLAGLRRVVGSALALAYAECHPTP